MTNYKIATRLFSFYRHVLSQYYCIVLPLSSLLVINILLSIHPTHINSTMSASAIYILDVKGKVIDKFSIINLFTFPIFSNTFSRFLFFQMLISRNYRGDIDMAVIEKFMPLLMEKEEESMVTPLVQTAECTFAYIKYNNLYIVATTKKNANIALVFVFLHKLVQVQ